MNDSTDYQADLCEAIFADVYFYWKLNTTIILKSVLTVTK